MQLMDDAIICRKVHTAWELVFSFSNKVLADEKRFGFVGMELIPDPDIHQMMAALSGMSSILSHVTKEFTLPPEVIRLIINAQSQITKMDAVASALKANDEKAFNLAMAELDAQAAF